MKFARLLALFVLLTFTVHADVYVSPEEHRAYARQGLEEQLSKVPTDQQVEFVQDLLEKIPLERQQLEMQISEAEAAQARGEHSGPPPYFLRKGFEPLKYKEEVMKEWLAAHKAGPQAKPSASPQSLSPVASPTVAGQPPQSPPSNSSANPSPGVPQTGTTALGSTHLMALALMGAGLLLGIRRALA